MIFGFLTARRRARLRAQPVPAEWHRIVERNLPIFRRLPPADQAELLGHVQVFVAEKHFEGCGGLALTDEIRVTIAAQACLLLLHRETDYYPRLRSILVYPTGYTAHEEEHVGDGIWEEGPEDRLGHTEQRLRALVLAWDAAKHGARDGVLRGRDGGVLRAAALAPAAASRAVRATRGILPAGSGDVRAS